MTVQAALLDMFAVRELTHPVAVGAELARGIYDEQGELVPMAGTEVQHVGPMLYLTKGALPSLVEGQELTLGALGAASAAGGRAYRVHRVDPIQDGLIVACTIGGGR